MVVLVRMNELPRKGELVALYPITLQSRGGILKKIALDGTKKKAEVEWDDGRVSTEMLSDLRAIIPYQ